MKILPIVLVRLGGFSFEEIEKLSAVPPENSRRELILEDFDAIFEQNCQQLMSYVHSDLLQNGLIFSSHVFLREIVKRRDCVTSKINKKERQFLRSLLVYISRIACKSSPFSVFSPISMLCFLSDLGDFQNTRIINFNRIFFEEYYQKLNEQTNFIPKITPCKDVFLTSDTSKKIATQYEIQQILQENLPKNSEFNVPNVAHLLYENTAVKTDFDVTELEIHGLVTKFSCFLAENNLKSYVLKYKKLNPPNKSTDFHEFFAYYLENYEEFRQCEKLFSKKSQKSILIQLFRDSENGLCGVVNQISVGYGKHFSRFLGLLPKQYSVLQNRWNTPPKDEIWVLNPAINQADFAQLSPLFESEIVLNGVKNENKNQILIENIEICNDNTLGIFLCHKLDEKRIKIFNIDDKKLSQNNELYHFFNLFAEQDAPITEFIFQENKKNKILLDSNIFHFPRIIIDKSIILQRKIWFVPKNSIPKKNSGDTLKIFFEKIRAWRLKLDVPSQIFLTIRPQEIFMPDEKNHYKPQFIDFDIPIFLDLWEKLVLKSEEILKIEEMLPAGKNLLTSDNQRVVAEFAIQWED